MHVFVSASWSDERERRQQREREQGEATAALCEWLRKVRAVDAMSAAKSCPWGGPDLFPAGGFAAAAIRQWYGPRPSSLSDANNGEEGREGWHELSVLWQQHCDLLTELVEYYRQLPLSAATAAPNLGSVEEEEAHGGAGSGGLAADILKARAATKKSRRQWFGCCGSRT